ncbi:MAG TPA: DUF885 domain-containing protein [Steroidobacteraceae bacterium]|nr:DUF885 domain-containing protein [Steroidobacteraceae bacterium]
MKALAALMIVAAGTSAALAADASDAKTELDRLFADERAFVWREDPLSATNDGVHDYDDRLPRVTPADQARRLETDRGFLERLRGIDRAALTEFDAVSYDLFQFMVSQRVALAAYREWRVPLNSDSGFHADLLQLHDLQAPRTTKDYENYIARLADVPRYFDENIANMRQGIKDGFVLPAEIIPGIASVIAAAQYAKAEDSPFWIPFAEFPAAVAEADRARLAAAGKSAIEGRVIPAFATFKAFYDGEYAPAARKSIGATELPDGKAYYADLVRYFTTLPDATAEKIHATGLAEVARIRAEMESIVREVGFAGSFDEFLVFLRTDPQFYAKTPEQLLWHAAWITREIDGHMPDYFGVIPRAPYTVKPVPAALAPNYTGGRYNPGPLGAAGEYWVNTYALQNRPLYVLPALSLHEAAPGHHTQGSRARELENVPVFRRNFYPHAFGEGWGLYSEYLGVEMGLYHTPYERFGRLTYEMWRACRLVVDTGMHAFGWSRQKALDYMKSNTALSEHEIRTEIDRYIAWPGQALAYKTGELEIKALRARAARELGPRFDLRAFHDAVLGQGGVTLPVLSKQIDAYIARARGS